MMNLRSLNTGCSLKSHYPLRVYHSLPSEGRGLGEGWKRSKKSTVSNWLRYYGCATAFGITCLGLFLFSCLTIHAETWLEVSNHWMFTFPIDTPINEPMSTPAVAPDGTVYAC